MTLAPNPNPSRVTAPLWWFWLQFKRMEPTALLGGFYAVKPGYHQTRNANARKDYSVLSLIDRAGPGDKASAIDITFPDAQAGRFATIAKYSMRLLLSGRDLHDERGNYLREFFGNADMDRQVEGWDFQRVGPASSDQSHVWHIHLSFSRGHVDNLKAMRAVLSILAGEPVKVWRTKEAVRLLPPKKPPVKPAPIKPPPAVKPPPKVMPPMIPPVRVVKPVVAVPLPEPDVDELLLYPPPPTGGGPFGDELPAPPATPSGAPPPAPTAGRGRKFAAWLRQFLSRQVRPPRK